MTEFGGSMTDLGFGPAGYGLTLSSMWHIDLSRLTQGTYSRH